MHTFNPSLIKRRLDNVWVISVGRYSRSLESRHSSSSNGQPYRCAFFSLFSIRVVILDWYSASISIDRSVSRSVSRKSVELYMRSSDWAIVVSPISLSSSTSVSRTFAPVSISPPPSHHAAPDTGCGKEVFRHRTPWNSLHRHPGS